MGTPLTTAEIVMALVSVGDQLTEAHYAGTELVLDRQNQAALMDVIVAVLVDNYLDEAAPYFGSTDVLGHLRAEPILPALMENDY